MESVNVLLGGAAVRGQMFPSTDANDASEEELEAESWTRGERGPHHPHPPLNLEGEEIAAGCTLNSGGL